ncbi:MAG: dodecin domain-containing protein [Acidobacteria bacterium]|nr:MAG: dodecin domain-containing protein [Acidobacteriota bacterium]
MSSVAKVIEISASSPKSFEDAIESGIAKAAKTVKNITGAWVNEEKVRVENGQVVEWRVNLKVSFVLDE